MTKRVVAYHPGKRFPAVSITGHRCELQCDHCRGHYLHAMADASCHGSLPRVAEALKVDGAKGLLVSGGCDRQGKVPLLDRVDEIRMVRRSGLTVNLHPGLLSAEDAKALVRSEADCYSLDLVQDPQTISEVLHLEAGPEAYQATLSALFAAGAARVVPHVCVGLRGDKIDGELACIDLATRFPISALVLLWHVPTAGTPMGERPNVSEASFLQVVEHATSSLRCPVLLGCMRPRGRSEMEREAVRLGVAGLALPSPDTVKGLCQDGYEVVRSERCCALHE